jgi:hypothetical protein
MHREYTQRCTTQHKLFFVVFNCWDFRDALM